MMLEPEPIMRADTASEPDRADEHPAAGERRALQQREAGESVIDAVPALCADWAFFLDIDGTLLDIARNPQEVRVDCELRSLLLRLAAASADAVALISGRSIADIDRLFAPLRFAAAGQHGAERRDYRGQTHRSAVPDARLSEARARLHELAASIPGLVLEDKGFNLALHYRMAPQHGAHLRRTLREIVATLGDEFDLQEGKMVLEIKPSGRNKGAVIAEFMQEEPFRGKTPVFLGDDLTDEFGFELVNRLGGHSFKIGAGASSATWRLADAAAVRAWLNGYCARFAPG